MKVPPTSTAIEPTQPFCSPQVLPCSAAHDKHSIDLDSAPSFMMGAVCWAAHRRRPAAGEIAVREICRDLISGPLLHGPKATAARSFDDNDIASISTTFSELADGADAAVEANDGRFCRRARSAACQTRWRFRGHADLKRASHRHLHVKCSPEARARRVAVLDRRNSRQAGPDRCAPEGSSLSFHRRVVQVCDRWQDAAVSVAAGAGPRAATKCLRRRRTNVPCQGLPPDEKTPPHPCRR